MTKEEGEQRVKCELTPGKTLSFQGLQETANLLPDLSFGNDIVVKKTMGLKIKKKIVQSIKFCKMETGCVKTT